MENSKIVKSLPEDEQQLVILLSKIVDIVGEIFKEQKNSNYPAGNIYPHDITREEFDQAAIRDPELRRFDTVVERVTASEYRAVPYNERYRKHYDKIIPLLQRARELSKNAHFRVYLSALVTCLQEGTEEAYQYMMAAWVKTKDYHINFPFTYDETYMDRLVGIKGGFNTAVFVEDKEFTEVIRKPLATWEKFVDTLKFPGDPKNFMDLAAAVYHTVNHQGVMADMKLRAWNLPNNFELRSEVGARQIIIRESTLAAFAEEFMPIATEVFPGHTKRVSKDELRTGLIWTLTLHELAHNIACYELEGGLEKYAHVFEELKAYVLPVMWIFYCQDKKVCSASEMEAAVTIFFAMNIMDCLLAQKVKARESYCMATLIHCNFLKDKGGIVGQGKYLTFDFADFVKQNSDLLAQITKIISRGNYDQAHRFVGRYGQMEDYEKEIITRLSKIIKTDD